MNEAYAYLLLGAIVLVALICYTVMAIFGSTGLDTMRDVLLGLVAGVTGGYAVRKHTEKNAAAQQSEKPPAKPRARR